MEGQGIACRKGPSFGHIWSGWRWGAALAAFCPALFKGLQDAHTLPLRKKKPSNAWPIGDT